MSRIWLDIVCGERRCKDEHGRVCCHWHYNHGACMCELFGPLRTALRTPAQLCDGGTPIRAEQCIRQTLPAHGPRPDARSDAIAQAFTEGALEAILERVEVLEKQRHAMNTALLSHVDAIETQGKKLRELEKRISEVDESHDRIIDRSCERLDALEQFQEWARKNFELKVREDT